MAVNVPLVHISDLTEQTTASDTGDYLVIGAADAKKIKWGTIWNLIKAKITGAASSIITSNLAGSRVLVSDSNGKVAVSAVTATELGYLGGVTGNVQTQFNNLKLLKELYRKSTTFTANGGTGTGAAQTVNVSFDKEYSNIAFALINKASFNSDWIRLNGFLVDNKTYRITVRNYYSSAISNVSVEVVVFGF